MKEQRNPQCRARREPNSSARDDTPPRIERRLLRAAERLDIARRRQRRSQEDGLLAIVRRRAERVGAEHSGLVVALPAIEHLGEGRLDRVLVAAERDTQVLRGAL